MSKIITIFSNPGTYGASTPDLAVSEKIASSQQLTAEGHETNEENFAKPRHVASIFNAISRGRSIHETAERIGIVSDSVDVERGAVKELSDAMTKLYGVSAENAIIGSIEVTDAQMAYLESNSRAMQVFIDNAIVQADSLAWDNDSVEDREDAVEAVNEAANDVQGLVDATYEAEWENYDEDYDDYDEDDEDDDYWGGDSYPEVSFEDEDDDEDDDEDEDEEFYRPLEYIEDDDINPRTKVIVMSQEDMDKIQREHNAKLERVDFPYRNRNALDW